MKIKIDPNSLKFKFWCYFAIFAILLMAIIWFLQIFFLQTYYQDMKTREIVKVANTISEKYSRLSVDTIDDFADTMRDYSFRNDMYIHIETDSFIVYAPSGNDLRPSADSVRDIDLVKRQLSRSPTGIVTYTMGSPSKSVDTLVYGKLIHSKKNGDAILCIFSPLSPVESTVGILANQLIYVTIISLLLAMALSVFISNRLTRPIRNITSNAAKLAEGDYSVTFDGGHYSEIIRLADTLNYTSKELAKSDNLHRDLIANVSHDLRTPLTMVKSYAEMIRDISGNNPEKRSAHLQVIIDESDRLNQLVSDLLVLSKMQAGVEELSLSKFNIRETVSGILKAYQFLSEQEGYHITFHCDQDLYVHADEARIKQVIANLVGNAIKHGGEEKSVTVTLTELPRELQDSQKVRKAGSKSAAKLSSKEKEKEKDRTKDAGEENPEMVCTAVRCEIRDTGPGIPEQDLEYIWERYYKASNNNARTQSGSGLGLAIVREILQLHGARFGVESQLGDGSTFWFELDEKNCRQS